MSGVEDAQPTLLELLPALPAAAEHVCPHCSRCFKKPSKLSRHVDELHNNVRRFGCDECPQFFKRKEQLKRHYLSHTHEKRFRCAECFMKFGYKHHLDRHVKLVHRKELYKCPDC